ncbi:DUF2845 domain-containing protein [Crenothrix sp.]|uniref:DUF2845 domain-containing protein n=1 Tax=Crenothrix sp. TaxID=3100433 RepID=UPI00374CD427
MKGLHGFIFLLCMSFSQQLFALKCEHRIVEPGDFKQFVYDLCGEPASASFHVERRQVFNDAHIRQFGFGNNRQFQNNRFNYGQAYGQEVDILVDEWIYDFGHSRLRQYLRFENDQLKEIRDLGRGRN